MSDLRAAAQQALEALVLMRGKYEEYACAACDSADSAITAIRAALTEPVQDQDVEDAIEAAYWHFDARKKGLNEWASAPQSERDAFKAEARKLAKGYFPTRQAQDTKRGADDESLVRFAALVAAAEREACAVAGGAAAMSGLSHDAVAAAIRARGNT